MNSAQLLHRAEEELASLSLRGIAFGGETDEARMGQGFTEAYVQSQETVDEASVKETACTFVPDLDTPLPTVDGHTGSVGFTTFSPQGKAIAGGVPELTKATEPITRNALNSKDQGIAHYDRYEFKEAITCFTKVIESDPGDVVAYINRGNAYHAQGRLDSAVADYSTAIRLAPKNAGVHIKRGNTYYDQGGSRSAVWRFFSGTKSASKKSLRAAEQERADVARARRRWMREQGMFDPARLVFIDETSTNTAMVRLRGRCPRHSVNRSCSARALEDDHLHRRPRRRAMVAPFVLDGPMNTTSFMAYPQTMSHSHSQARRHRDDG